MEFTAKEKKFIAGQRVIRFNSFTHDGQIHSVPICFAFNGNGFYFHCRQTNSRRWQNIRGRDTSSVELDYYSDDWSKLKGILVFGRTRFLERGPEHDEGLSLLRKKYVQYRRGDFKLEDSMVLAKLEPTRAISWYVN